VENNAEKCIFIGYKDGIKGYKLWNPVTKKIVYSWDLFLEMLKMFPNKNSYQGNKNMRK